MHGGAVGRGKGYRAAIAERATDRTVPAKAITLKYISPRRRR
jgi:hypothetical protein